MTVYLYNSLTKTTQPLVPLDGNTVRIYSCGPTVYDRVHIGNLSAFMMADVLRRTIAAHGYETVHVMNFTDVDDKTIHRSRERYPDTEPLERLRALTTEYSDLFLEDMSKIGNDTEAMTFLKATDDSVVQGMRDLITQLHTDGFAYTTDDGVYFNIEAYKQSGKTYGQLVEITESTTGKQRIQNDEYDKESAHDFALWKTQKPGEPAWGFTLDGHDLAGRPGWHVECSVMSNQGLGTPFDVHTGGIDLQFPHHENEIAQSTAGKDSPVYASMFVHNEHILVDGKKMAKSANNFYTLTDLAEKGVEPMAFRLLVLQSHYRKPSHFSLENAEAARNRLRHWYAVATLRWQTYDRLNEQQEMDPSPAAIGAIREALGDDLNTAEALRIIDETFSDIEAHDISKINQQTLTQLLEAIDAMLGLDLIARTPDITDEQKQLLMARQHARDEKDWAASDKYRDELKEQGVIVRDTAQGVVWERALESTPVDGQQ